MSGSGTDSEFSRQARRRRRIGTYCSIMAIAVLIAAAALSACPRVAASNVSDTFTWSLLRNQFSNAVVITIGTPYAETFTLDVYQQTSGAFVDVVFLDRTNYVYWCDSVKNGTYHTITYDPALSQFNVYGHVTLSSTITAPLNTKYYVETDNTANWPYGGSTCSYTSGYFDISWFVVPVRVSGHVYTATGTPIPGATVTCSPGGYSTPTDSFGYYSFSVAPGDTYTLTASAAGYLQNTATVSVQGSDVTQNLYLTAANHNLAGHVYKSGTTQAISGASVSVTPGSHSTSTDASGYYSVSVPDGTYSISVSATGYQAKTDTGVVVSGSDATHDVFLTANPPATYQVSGHVYVTGTTTGISGAALSFSSGTYSATTDSSGHYSVSGVPSGTYSVAITATGYQSATGTVTVSGADATKDFTMTAQPAGTYQISGHVYVTGTTTGISGAALSFSSGTYSATTDSSGHYSVSGVPSGTYSVAITATGYQSATGTVTVSGADATKDFAMTAQAAGTHQISGHVYESGTTTAISGATVRTSSYSATTDSSGHYSISVPDGTYTISVSASGYESASMSVTVSGSDVTKNIELTPTGQGGQTLSGPVMAGSLIVVIVVVGIALVLLLKRKKSVGPPQMRYVQPPVPPPMQYGQPPAPPPTYEQPPPPPPPGGGGPS